MAAAALLSGFVTAAAAQGPVHDSIVLPLQPAQSTNSLDPVRTTDPSASAAGATGMGRAGNPLWTIALGELAETLTRPLFSPSRRPPAPPVLASVVSAPAQPTPPRKPGPDHPLLTLLGTIVGDSLEIGVFTDEVSHDVVRLKSGESHDGWTLSSVSGRTATFQKQGYLAATLVFPAPGADANTLSVTSEPVVTGRSGQMTGVPAATPPNPYPIPGSTKGEFKRPARQG